MSASRNAKAWTASRLSSTSKTRLGAVVFLTTLLLGRTTEPGLPGYFLSAAAKLPSITARWFCSSTCTCTCLSVLTVKTVLQHNCGNARRVVRGRHLPGRKALRNLDEIPERVAKRAPAYRRVVAVQATADRNEVLASPGGPIQLLAHGVGDDFVGRAVDVEHRQPQAADFVDGIES